ncbi:sugar ABC transporter substrate-binding protein [Armatimonadota bacterium]|nr:sugar ABC transporter substrate-binding protein [Armatimonadota bacterium]
MRRLLLVIGIFWIVAGCASPTQPTDSGGAVTLHLADWGGASADTNMNRFQQEVDAEWARIHPNIRIELEHIPGSGEYVPKLLTSIVAHTEPDMVSLDASSAAIFIENNALKDLAPFAKAESFDEGVYYPNVLGLAKRGDQLFALPADFTPMMLYYNKRLFDKAGIPYPSDGWTWEEFLQTCRKLTIASAGSHRPSQYGFIFDNWMPGWIMWLWQAGGDVLSPDGKRSVGYLDSTEAANAVRFFTDIVKERLAPSLSETASQGVDLFSAGKVAMKISGHWSIVGFKASETIHLEDVGVVSLPRKKKRITVMYEMGYAMTRGCKHPKEAWEYIKFLSGAFVQRKRAELGIGISAHRAIAEERRHTNPLEPVFLDNVQYAVPPWGARVENYAQVEDIGKEMVDEILIGNKPVELALHEAAKRIQAEVGTP